MPISRNRPVRLPSRPMPPAPGAGAVPPRPAASGRRRAVRRIAAAVLFGLALLALDRSGLAGRWLAPLEAGRLDWSNDYRLVQQLRALVVRRHLTTDRPDCLLFILDGNDPPSAERMQVMEKHSGTCPGTPGTLPRLFTLKVDRVGHAVQDDLGSPGHFHPLP